MSGSEPNLFLRKEDELKDSEEWDDTELVAAYNKAISSIKKKLTRKIQRELGLKDEDIQEFLSEAESSSSKLKKKKGGKKKKKGWKVGSSCRAVYSEDGEEYEAVIVAVIDSHWCVVRFVGYENEEEVLLEDLLPSLGKTVVEMQIEAASRAEQEDFNEKVQYEEDLHYTDEVPKAKVEQELYDKIPSYEGYPKTFEPIRRFPMTFPIPPLPPMPSVMKCEESFSRQDDFSAMLMSWYMCGYYTGLYERGKHLEKNN